ncbi:MAG: L-fucose/L-arabinose isomerase family protein [Phycisphaerae bacterium]|nr:L-fucose/L-arabinose isomerase family protein [Phycisphaerae bacterium]MDD5381793.1 L-fucose/L-arabinose isomerase family protein [Phycisphaerae bacterium]
MKKTTFGVIVGNRGFFPDYLAKSGRKEILDVLKKNDFNTVSLSMQDAKYGAIETFADAKKCAALFAKNSENIDGIIVTLPNFGDERGVAETIKRSGLKVPILIQAEPDISGKMTIADRRDSFCGKISVCNNLRQAGIPYTLTKSHTVKAASVEFKRDIDDFASVCRIVKGLQNVRFGAIGARPAAFNTVRYSEKLLALSDITVETLDLSEVLGKIELLSDNDRAVKAKLSAIGKYIPAKSIPADALLKMAKFGVVLDRWIKDNEINGTAVQCWTSLEEFFGIVPCTLMSMMSESLTPSACEVDITGLLGMYILQLAGGTPSAILDWNNNYADDPDKCVLFHCSNIPLSFFKNAKMDYQEIIAGTVGKENTYGTVVGRIAPNEATFCRTTTDDTSGVISAYTGEGQFTNDKLDTFGGFGVMRIPNLQNLLRYICRMGFEHHVAVNICQKADAIAEALGSYMGWEVYRHR